MFYFFYHNLLEILPKQIEALEKHNCEIEAILSDHNLHNKNPEKFSELSTELVKNQHDISTHIELWVHLEEKK